MINTLKKLFGMGPKVDFSELMKQGAINTMSFSFYIIKSTFESNGIERISEVSLLEISPVVFASNENAEIETVRSEDLSIIKDSYIERIKVLICVPLSHARGPL